MRLIFILFLGVFYFNYVSAAYIPDNFKHFYEDKKMSVDVNIGTDIYFSMDVEASYRGVKSISNRQAVIKKLTEFNVNKEGILAFFYAVVKDGNCHFDGCENIRYKFSYDKRVISLILPYNFFSEEQFQNPFTSLSPNDNAIISEHRGYLTYSDETLTGSYRLNNYIGLSKGFLDTSLNVNYNNELTDINLDEFIYEHNFPGHKLSVGYSDFTNSSENALDKLEYTTATNNYFGEFRTSNALLKKNKSAMKFVIFDLSSDGLVEFYRNDKFFKSAYFRRGKNTISYEELPFGNYELKLKVISEGGGKDRMIIKKISNHNNKESIYGYDYSFKFSQSKSVDSDEKINYFETKGINSDSFGGQYGAVLRLSEKGSSIGGYLSNSFYDDVNVEGFYDYFTDESKYFSFGVNLWGVNFNYEKFRAKGKYSTSNRADFSSFLYGDGDSSQLSLSFSAPLADGYLTLYSDVLETEREFGMVTNVNTTVSYNQKIFGFTDMTLSFGIQDYLSEENMSFLKLDEMERYFSIAFDIPLSTNVSSNTYFENRSDRSERLVNTITKNDLLDIGEHFETQATVGQSLQKNNSRSYISFNGSYYDDNLTSSLYGSFDSESDLMINGSFTTSSVYDYEKVNFTNRFKPSYIVVDTNLETSEGNVGTLDLSRTGLSSSLVELQSGTNLVALEGFNTYKYYMDFESKGYSSVKKPGDVLFSYPGTVTRVKESVKKVTSFLTYFEDFNRKKVNEISCRGPGCVSVSKVGDGIFSISVFENEGYKLVSNGERCLSEPTSDKMLSLCFPKINEDPNSGLQIVESGFGEKDERLVFFGGVEKDVPDYIKSELKEHNLELIVYPYFNGFKYLFVKLSADNNLNNSDIASLDVTNKLERLVTTRRPNEYITKN